MYLVIITTRGAWSSLNLVNECIDWTEIAWNDFQGTLVFIFHFLCSYRARRSWFVFGWSQGIASLFMVFLPSIQNVDKASSWNIWRRGSYRVFHIEASCCGAPASWGNIYYFEELIWVEDCVIFIVGINIFPVISEDKIPELKSAIWSFEILHS